MLFLGHFTRECHRVEAGIAVPREGLCNFPIIAPDV
jgi:hypothetical protein